MPSKLYVFINKIVQLDAEMGLLASSDSWKLFYCQKTLFLQLIYIKAPKIGQIVFGLKGKSYNRTVCTVKYFMKPIISNIFHIVSYYFLGFV